MLQKFLIQSSRHLYKTAHIQWQEGTATIYAKLKLEELCTRIGTTRSRLYENPDDFFDAPDANQKRIVGISKALLGFKKDASTPDKELAQAFLKEIAGE